jgi:NADH:ubiquinone oxidoreductase subunit 4 (subunit M)
VVAVMVGALLWLGLYPRPVLETFAPVVQNLQESASQPVYVLRR